ncbi:MAG: hypothetical protein MJZ86_05240 [Bacteroidales bacterium]|nr:hypothetical protein [Bacteroidales bacterium]
MRTTYTAPTIRVVQFRVEQGYYASGELMMIDGTALINFRANTNENGTHFRNESFGSSSLGDNYNFFGE